MSLSRKEIDAEVEQQLSRSLVSGEKRPELEVVYAAEARVAPPKKLALTLCAYILMLAFVLVRGGKGIQSVLGMQVCSSSYWTFTVVFTVLCAALVAYFGREMVTEHNKYVELGYQWESDDVVWNTHSCMKFAVSAFLTAVGMGLLSVTGGLFIAPLLYAYGIRPEVTAATCSFLSFFTSSISFVQFAAVGMVNFEYGMFFASASVLGSLIGVTQVERVKSNSTLVFLLAFVFALAAALMGTFGALKMLDQGKRGLLQLAFRNYC